MDIESVVTSRWSRAQARSSFLWKTRAFSDLAALVARGLDFENVRLRDEWPFVEIAARGRYLNDVTFQGQEIIVFAVGISAQAQQADIAVLASAYHHPRVC